MKRIGLITLLIAIPSLGLAANYIERFAFSEDLAGWQVKEFDRETQYRVESQTLVATCDDSASALVFEKDVDLEKTPILSWSWKVENVYEGTDERTKSGDDFPARIYVIKEKGLFGMGTLAMNYVWSSNQAVGTDWQSAYTDQAQMRAVDSGTDKLGVWRTHRRNVRQDFKRLFGEDIGEVDGIAIMTDCDDAGQSARAHYRKISFVSK